MTKKEFDIWNEEKKVVDKKVINRDLFFHPREVWWCSAGLNIGVEANGKNENFERPFLILKKFNAHMVWAVPLTSKIVEDEFHLSVSSGEWVSSVVLSQIKTLSTKRLLRRVRIISDEDFIIILRRVIGFLENEIPLSGKISEA
jgi:mRNA interferase MazF